jgi:alkylation response protein AidB-like acyl-CoA dehydrogenase
VQTAVAAGLDVEAAALGRELWTVALAERAGSGWGAWAATFGSPATGTKVGVPHGADADVLVAAGAEDRVALVVPAATQPRTCLDPSLRTADVDLAMCTVRSDAPGARVALARAAVVLAADLAGVGKGALGLGAEYASVREQFNQPIGRFQGVSHQLADAFVEIEAGWNLVLYASWALDAGTADAVSMAHAALAKTGAAAVHAAERTLQVHGGIGVTWEGDPHLYIRRALALNAVLGGHAAHAREVGRSLVGSA